MANKHCRFKEEMAEVNLDKLQSWVDQGRLNPSRPITMIELVESGCVSSVRDGIKLLSRVRFDSFQPNFKVTRQSNIKNREKITLKLHSI
jgi:large subunit ribosomal protein L15